MVFRENTWAYSYIQASPFLVNSISVSEKKKTKTKTINIDF